MLSIVITILCVSSPELDIVEGIQGIQGKVGPLIQRGDAGGAGADARDTSTSYPCYKATCAGNATCCHYGEADMCCWNGGGGVAGPVSWLCGGVPFGMSGSGLCCPPDSPVGCPGFGTSCCTRDKPVCCQKGGCCPLGYACHGAVNGTQLCAKLPLPHSKEA
eukprot:gene10069-4481_t